MNDNGTDVRLAYDRLNSLLEAAIRDQQAIRAASAALKALQAAMDAQRKTQPQEIVGALLHELEQVIDTASTQLTARIDSANLSAATAEVALSAATRRASWVVLIPALAVGFASLALSFFSSTWILSSLREEKAGLEANIAALESRGAKLDWAECGGKDKIVRLCVRVDNSVNYDGGYRAIVPKH